MDYSLMQECEEGYRSSGESSVGFSIQSAMALRKNLAEKFDQEVTAGNIVKSGKSNKSSSNNNHHHKLSSSTVASTASRDSVVVNRIAQFEAAANAASTKPPLHQKPAHATSNNNGIPANRVAVYLRIRPPPLLPTNNDNNSKENPPASSSNNNTIEVLKPRHPMVHPTVVRTYPPVQSNTSKINSMHHEAAMCAKEFEFHQVLEPDTTQKTVYATVAAPMIQSLWEATISPRQQSQSAAPPSALIFSYGITNAGKTHTILGDVKSKSDAKWGVIPRAISDVFDRINQVPKISGHYDLYVSYFEIYNEQIYDLVPKKSSSNTCTFGQPKNLKVSERSGQTIVRGLARHKLRDVQHAVEITTIANSRRHTSSNNLNSGSSRSHCVCQLQIMKRPSQAALAQRKDDDTSSVVSMSGYSTDEELASLTKHRSSSIWIVDLAGSERSKRTGMGSARQKEASQINKSLMTLMRCLTVMRESGRQNSSNVVPFRESKLTHVFMSHLAGPSASRTAMVVNVNPAIADFDETQHVLAYASQAKMIQMNPEEMNQKRKEYFGDEYGMDGRKKVRSKTTTSNAATRMVSKMAKKLSPKKMAQKLFRPKPDGKQTDLKPVPAATKKSKAPSVIENQPAGKRIRTNFSTAVASGILEKDVSVLKTELQAVQDELEVLRCDNQILKEELENQEIQIRMEVSEEMEELLREVRQKKDDEIERLRLQLKSNPLACRSSRKAEMDQVESHIQELMDKVDECEEEMVRMRHDHHEEMKKQKHEYETEISALKEILNKMNDTASKEGTNKPNGDGKKIAELERELAASRTQNERLEKSKIELVENYEKLLKENEGEEQDEEEEQEAQIPLWKQKLLRKRQASQNEQSSQRKPLSQISSNVLSSQPEESGGKQQWIFPKNPSSHDENGGYQRPSGRAPNGRVWDAGVGAWKVPDLGI